MQRVRLDTTVVALGVVSFFTDLSSEMIVPLLPLFLSTAFGAGPVALGVIEGVAESAAALLKASSGYWTDRVRRRKPFIVAGYALASLARPLIGVASGWPVVLGLRFADRVGKGIRTSPRDALIADVTAAGERGRAYGLQRSLDHAGAVVGPLVALALLSGPGVSLRQVFLCAAVPATIVVVLVVVTVREPPAAGPTPTATVPRPAAGGFGRRYLTLLLAVGLFTLGNSTDAFLLLKLGREGVPAAGLAALWAAFHVVKTVATSLGGRASDRLGRRGMVLAGWAWYAAVYLGFAVVHGRAAVIAVFLLYGVYFGLTEPVERAWVAEMVPAARRGAAFGWYHGVVGLAALPASVAFGAIWWSCGEAAAFLTGAALAAAAAVVVAVGLRPDGPAVRAGE